MCDLINTTKPPLLAVYMLLYPVYMVCLYWYTGWLLGKHSTDFVSAIYKISIFPSTISSKSSTLFLMELIFRSEKDNVTKIGMS